MKAKKIIILILIIIFAIIVFQNRSVVELQLLFWKIEMSRIIFYTVNLVLGMIIGAVITSLIYSRKIKKIKSEQFLNKHKE